MGVIVTAVVMVEKRTEKRNWMIWSGTPTGIGIRTGGRLHAKVGSTMKIRWYGMVMV